MKFIEISLCIFGLLYLIGWLSLIGVAIYVIYHFVSKLW